MRARSACFALARLAGSMTAACSSPALEMRCHRHAAREQPSLAISLLGARPGVGETLSRFTDHAARDNERVTSAGRPKCSSDTVALLVRGGGGWCHGPGPPRPGAGPPRPRPGRGLHRPRAIVRGDVYIKCRSHNMTPRATVIEQPVVRRYVKIPHLRTRIKGRVAPDARPPRARACHRAPTSAEAAAAR